MATSILSSLLSSNKLTITEESQNLVVWSEIKTSKVEFMVPTQITDLPQTSTDYYSSAAAMQSVQNDLLNGKVIYPVEVRITCACEDIATVWGIIDLFNDVTKTFTIASKSIIAKYMSVTEITITQNAEMVSAARLDLKFEQAPPYDEYNFNPKQDGDKSTYGVHVQTTSSLTVTVGQLYNKVSQAIGL